MLDDANQELTPKKPKRYARIPTYADVKTIEILTSIGLSKAAIGNELLISEDTLERWQNEYEEIDSAFRIGKLRRQKRAYQCFFSQAFPIDESGRPTGKGDTALMIFWMKTREKWKEPDRGISLRAEENVAPLVEFALKQEITKTDPQATKVKVEKSNAKAKKQR